jgi:hypothetical protein
MPVTLQPGLTLLPRDARFQLWHVVVTGTLLECREHALDASGQHSTANYIRILGKTVAGKTTSGWQQ